MIRRRLAAMATLAALATAGCSRLMIFNTVMPKDGGVARIARDIPYAPLPRQTLDLYAPRHPGPGKLPIIVFFYGGSWDSGVKEGYGFVGRALAARGFLVAIPDYRLVPQVRYPAFVEDGAAAVRWVIAHAGQYGADPARIVLAGHSAGAYNAAMLAYDPRWLGADQRNLRGFIGLAGPYDFDPFDGAVARAAFAGVTDPAEPMPVTHLTPGAPPAFLATAGKDHTVRARNSASLAAHLRAAGTAVDLRAYPEIGHVGIITALAVPFRGRASVLDDMAAFASSAVRE